MEIFFYNKKIASDIQWSRYLVLLSVTTAIMVLLGIISMIIVSKGVIRD